MLFEPLTIGSMEVKNRIMRSATWEGMATPDDGLVTDKLVALYEELARGGTGLIVTGFVSVLPAGKALPGQLGIYSDEHISGLGRLAGEIHESGAKAAVQLVHAGVQTRPEVIGRLPQGPSAVLDADGEPKAEALTEAEIDEVVAAFGAAAGRAKEAGFDAVQLHCAHGYLLNQFLSPARNQRDDSYGGSARARYKAPLLVYRAVREAVGPDFPVLAKLNSEDYVEGGLSLEESLGFAKALTSMGLDGLEVSGGVPAAGKLGAVRPVQDKNDEAYFRRAAREFKRVLDIPVYLVGGIRSRGVANALLRKKNADGVALSRPLIREPNLPKLWESGDQKVSACVSCRKCLKAGRAGGIACLDLAELETAEAPEAS